MCTCFLFVVEIILLATGASGLSGTITEIEGACSNTLGFLPPPP